MNRLAYDHSWAEYVMNLLIPHRGLEGVSCALLNLEILRLADTSIFQIKHWCDMVESRWWADGEPDNQPRPIARLKVVDVKLKLVLDAEATARLEVFKMQGLDLVVTKSFLRTISGSNIGVKPAYPAYTRRLYH